MFIKLSEWLTKNRNLSRPNRGIVKDNLDPKKLGRLKIEVIGFLEGLTTIELPWIYPLNAYGLGGKSDSSGFSVPEIGSELVVIFPYDDIYFGFYTGYWQSSVVHQTALDIDYPETYGWLDSTGLQLKVNKAQEQIDFIHPSGVTISIDSGGNVSITTSGKKTEIIAANLDMSVGGNASAIVSGAKTEVVGTNLSLNVGTMITVAAGGIITITSPLIQTLGLTDLSGGNLQLLVNALFAPLFDAHVHTSSSSGSPTSPPLTPIDNNMITTGTRAG